MASEIMTDSEAARTSTGLAEMRSHVEFWRGQVVGARYALEAAVAAQARIDAGDHRTMHEQDLDTDCAAGRDSAQARLDHAEATYGLACAALADWAADRGLALTTTKLAAAVSRTPASVRRQADRFATRTETPRGVVYDWPATAPDGRAWSPEVWLALVGTGGRPRREG